MDEDRNGQIRPPNYYPMNKHHSGPRERPLVGAGPYLLLAGSDCAARIQPQIPAANQPNRLKAISQVTLSAQRPRLDLASDQYGRVFFEGTPFLVGFKGN